MTANGKNERVLAKELDSLAGRLALDAKSNTEWRREQCLNLIPSEQCTSGYVDALCNADPASRYNEHKRLHGTDPDAPPVRFYRGTEFIMEKEDELKNALMTFFDCNRVEPRVISGQMANATVYDALLAFRNRNNRGKEPRRLSSVLTHSLAGGGHLSAQAMGALKNYVGIDKKTKRAAVRVFPALAADPYALDVEATKQLIERTKPELIVFGRSVILYKEPVREISQFVFEHFGEDNPLRPLIMYDGAHVLGLLGPHFQAPFVEGADIITGSTHKTFFGPQRGVILGNIGDKSPFSPLWNLIETRAFPGQVSNHHLGTLLGLLGASYEMLAFKDEYPQQVIKNASAFAKALAANKMTVEGSPDSGYTQTHQVVIRGDNAKGNHCAELLEQNNIITNGQALHDDANFAGASGIRMGTAEMTRYGMREQDFEAAAELIANILTDGNDKSAGHWRGQVIEMRTRFSQMRYCFDGKLAQLIAAAQA